MEDKTQQLHSMQEKYRNQFFLMGLELIAYFGVPAVIGIFVGKKLDAMFETRFVFLLVSLAVAYVFSWVIFYFRFQNVKKNLKNVQDELKKQKEENNPEKII